MKKTILVISTVFFLISFLISSLISSVCIASETSIRSKLGIPFGHICTIKAEFIEKPNDYYSQNISHAKFYLKIIEISNKKLPSPLIIEPVYEDIEIETGKIYILKAYETIQSGGYPSGWTKEPQQFNYEIIHKVRIKNP